MATLDGTSGLDTLSGGGGADTITGFANDDSLSGGRGDDLIFGDFGDSSGGVDGTPLIMSFANVQTGSDTSSGNNGSKPGDSVIYENMATLEDGTVVNGKLVFVSTTSGAMPVDISGGEGYEILLNSGGNNAASFEDDFATFRLEFIDAATGLPVSVNSVITFNDLDANSATDTEDVRINGGSFTNYGISSDSNVSVTENGSVIEASGSQFNSPEDQQAWFSATFENKSSVTFELSPRTTQSGFSLNGAVIDNPDVSAIPQGNDTIDGGLGNDQIYGGGGDDSATGGEGNDYIEGGAGNDTLFGDVGSDTIVGDTGADTLFGGGDDDTLLASQTDTAFGGGGDDIFTVDPSLGDVGDITIVGGETDEGGADTTNGGAGDVLDLSDLYANDLIEEGSLVFDPNDPEAGSVRLTDGTVINFSEIENFICFTRGTMILTAEGEKPIEELMLGDKVVTRDHGLQTLRWLGSRVLPARGKMAPIMFKAGSIGNSKDLLVSPQHRMLITGWKAEMLYGEEEVLVAAKHLVNGDSVFVAEGGQVEYVHILFDAHELVTANGTWSESFHPGEEGIDALTDDAREEVFTLFPELRAGVEGYGPVARTSLKAHEAAILAENPEFIAP